jgi:SRSO17 transposase
MNMKAVPKAAPTPLLELETYLQPFTKLFRRSWSRLSCERYITGLLTDLLHKNCEPIAATLAGTSTERLQHLLTDADWDAQALHRLRVQHLMSFSPRTGYWLSMIRVCSSKDENPWAWRANTVE